MGLDTLLSEEAFVATYPEGPSEMQSYRLARALHRSGDDFKGIARSISRPYTTVYQWLHKGLKPRCVHGFEKANELGLVPLTADSRAFLPLVRLYSWVFWSGSVGANHAVGISEHKPQLEALLPYFRETLGLEGEVKQRASSADAGYCTSFGEGGKLYGRVLRAMGIPVEGKKTEHELHVPQAIRATLEARKEYLTVMFLTRLNGHSNRNKRLRIIQNRTADGAYAFAREISALINETLPGAGIQESDISLSRQKRTYQNYQPIIKIPRETVCELAQKHQGVIALEPRVISYQAPQSARPAQSPSL
jgi:hypothetical protein